MVGRTSIAKLVELQAKLPAMLAEEEVPVPLHHAAVRTEESAVYEHQQRLAKIQKAVDETLELREQLSTKEPSEDVADTYDMEAGVAVMFIAHFEDIADNLLRAAADNMI